MSKVNLFLVGAGKSGTSSLASALQSHPEVFVPSIKEPGFFSTYTRAEIENIDPGSMRHGRTLYMRDKKDYEKLFSEAKSFYKLDASTAYLHDPSSAAKIHAYNADAKIIILLRDPLERAISNHLMHLRSGLTSHDFISALKSFYIDRQSGMSNYIKLSLYFNQVFRYIDLFGESVHVMVYDEYRTEPHKALQKLFKHLDISVLSLDNKIVNQGVAPRVGFRYINKFLYHVKPFVGISIRKRLKKYFFVSSESGMDLDTLTKDSLYKQHFEEDVWRLEQLLGRKFRSWGNF